MVLVKLLGARESSRIFTFLLFALVGILINSYEDAVKIVTILSESGKCSIN